MAGILDKKTRFIDLVVTQEGKRQIASGMLRAEFASVTDMHTFYDKNEHDNVSERIYFQAMERPENMIVLEKDDSGKLIDIDFSPSGSIAGDNLFDKDTTTTGSLKLEAVTGSAFSSLSDKLMRSFLHHFKRNHMIGTFENSEANNQFEISEDEINFTITNSVPFPLGPANEVINVNNATPFFFDEKMSHLPNFEYLPPVNTDGSSYGKYNDLRGKQKETLDDIKNALGVQSFIDDDIESSLSDNPNLKANAVGDYKVFNRDKLLPVDVGLPKEYHSVHFLKTSEHNNLLIQVFENSKASKLTKLDILDAGSFYDEDDVNGRSEKRIFYVGKVFLDDYNTPTFINIFTIVMD